MPFRDALAPRLRALFEMTLRAETVVPTIAAATGQKTVVRVTDGHFEGDRLRGRVLGGEDWLARTEDGIVRLNVRLSLRLESGDCVLMRYAGLRHGPERAMTALSNNEIVDPKDYYFRISCTFETASPDHSWLNRTMGIGRGARYPDRVEYSIWEIL